MALGINSIAEFNTVITMLGCLFASIQASTGFYAAFYKGKTSVLRTNEIFNRTHRAFGGFATILYYLGLFQGLTGFIGGLLQMEGSPPFEPGKFTFNLHVWISFPIMVIITWKTYISYFDKQKVFKRGKILGMLTFFAWVITWATSCIAFYVNVEGNPWVTPGLAHKSPGVLLPATYWGLILQIFIPFILAALIAWPLLWKGHKIEVEKEKKPQLH